MEPEAYTTQEVIEALRAVGITEEVIEYVVPILGFESRVNGVPFTRNAKDELSNSWGVVQAHIDKEAMAPAVYQAMVELGVKIPRVSLAQNTQLTTNVHPEGKKDLRYFTPSQLTVVENWFEETASLDDQALVFKKMLEQKIQEKSYSEIDAINDLYPFTVSRFGDLENADAQALKKQIEDEMKMEQPPVTTTTTVPEQDADRGVPIPSATPSGKVIDQDTGKYTGEQILPHSGRVVTGQYANKYLKQLDKITRFEPRPQTQANKSPVDKGNEFFSNQPVGPVTKKIRSKVKEIDGQAQDLVSNAISFLRGD